MTDRAEVAHAMVAAGKGIHIPIEDVESNRHAYGDRSRMNGRAATGMCSVPLEAAYGTAA